MEEQNIKTDVIELIKELKEYLNLRSNLISMQVKGIAAELIAGIGSNILLIVFSSMAFLFGSIALAFYLGEKYNSNSIGFLMVAGIYVLLLIIALMAKKSIKTFISNTVIAQLFKESNYENDQE